MARTVLEAITATDLTAWHYQPRFIQSRGGVKAPTILNSDGNYHLEAASLDAKQGDLVYLATGVVTELIPANAVVAAGFMLQDASNSASPTAYPKIMCLHSDCNYMMNLHSTTPSQVTKAAARLLKGNTYELGQVTVTYPAASTRYTGNTVYTSVATITVHTNMRVKLIDVFNDPHPLARSTDTHVPVIVCPIEAFVLATPIATLQF